MINWILHLWAFCLKLNIKSQFNKLYKKWLLLYSPLYICIQVFQMLTFQESIHILNVYHIWQKLNYIQFKSSIEHIHTICRWASDNYMCQKWSGNSCISISAAAFCLCHRSNKCITYVHMYSLSLFFFQIV